ncbi:MAG: hypothetical protein PHE32_01945 [Candidatus Shapirobacteria bacterium]|nr:hypothetical protein [Candidatus Shapirobacteria bacterium]MDD4410435.1 hypothetical protein [Candidatus Shapirobacteria bacterium]
MSLEKNKPPNIDVSSTFAEILHNFGEEIKIRGSKENPNEIIVKPSRVWQGLPRKKQDYFQKTYDIIQEQQKFLDLQKENTPYSEYLEKQKKIDQDRLSFYENIKECQDSNYDKQTGLVLLNYIKEETALQLSDLINKKEGSQINNIVFLVVDLKKLKESNVLLGISETDNRIKNLSEINLAISQYLSIDQKNTVYSPDTENILESDTLNNFFVKNPKAKDLLKKFKNEKLLITPSRKQAGGDEFLFKIDFDKYSPEQEKAAINLIRQTFNFVSISPIIELIDKDQKYINEQKILKENPHINPQILPSEQYHQWYDAINSLKYVSTITRVRDESKKKNQEAVIKTIGVEKLEATVHFFDKLRSYFIEHQQNKSSQYCEIFKPENQLSFDFAHLYFDDATLPNLYDALLMYIIGMDTRGNFYQQEGLFGLDGKKNDKQFNKSLSKIYKEYDSYTIINPRCNREELLNQIISNNAIEKFFDIIFNDLESIGKKDKTNNDLYNACLGNSKKILSLGMSSFVDRGIHKFASDDISPKSKALFAQKLFFDYLKRYKSEIKKPESKQNRPLISFVESLYQDNCLKYIDKNQKEVPIPESVAKILSSEI